MLKHTWGSTFHYEKPLKHHNNNIILTLY